jgi:colanic acid biosynthesis glycosyl transferase WcaI
MRVLILSINYWPEVTGIGAFTTYRAEYLASAGHDVEVCTSFPYYPEWKVPKEYAGKLAQTEVRNGVRILRGYLYVPNPVTSLKRILHEASFICSCTFRALFRRRPHVLLVVSPPLGLAVTAILLSRLWRIPFVFDVEDLQPDSASDLAMLPAWAIRLLYKLEHAAYRKASLVTTLTAGMKKKIVSKGIPAAKVEVLEPRMDDSLTSLSDEEGAAFRQRHGLGEKFLITHSGNMGVKQGLDVVLNAAALVHGDGSLLFLLVGDGADRKRIQLRAQQLGLSNVRFLPLLDDAGFRGLLAASDVCLVAQQKGVTEIAFPSKIVTYLAAGRPIIAAVNPESEVARIVETAEAGVVVAAEDSAALLAAIRNLRAQDPAAMRENARRTARERWSPDRVFGQLDQCLSLVAGTAVRAIMKQGVGQ